MLLLFKLERTKVWCVRAFCAHLHTAYLWFSFFWHHMLPLWLGSLFLFFFWACLSLSFLNIPCNCVCACVHYTFLRDGLCLFTCLSSNTLHLIWQGKGAALMGQSKLLLLNLSPVISPSISWSDGISYYLNTANIFSPFLRSSLVFTPLHLSLFNHYCQFWFFFSFYGAIFAVVHWMMIS